MSPKNSVEFKGTKEGIVLQLDSELEFCDILKKLEDKIKKSAGFFKGAKIIGVDGRTATQREKQELEGILTTQGEMAVESLNLVPKTNGKTSVKNPLNSEANSDKTDTSKSDKKPIVDKVISTEEGDAVFTGLKEGMTQFVRGTLRSGRSVVFSGNVVVLGDVNPGAEIIADGNIVVMGHLRGVAHAGANGNHAAYICANQLNPTQLRIGKLITRPPDEVDGADPEIAIVKGDMIVIEPYLI